MPKYIRIFLEPQRSDDELDKWCIDAFIDSKDKIIGKWFLHGTRSYDDPSYLTPFICHVDGRIDFGFGYEDRFYRTNIRQRLMQVGRMVSLWDERDKEQVYRIARIHKFES